MKEIKLHLGCGKVNIPEFIHVDLANYPHIDYNQSIMNLFEFEDDSVDLIYCCHALEYFDREEALEALTDWHRTLKKGGTLRLAVPDFEAIVKVYQKYGDIEHRGILGPLYGKMLVGFSHIYHKTVYDFNSLKKTLEGVGFKNVHRYDWRETEHADIDDSSQSYIPHMDKDNGMLISLNVECEK